MSKSRSHRRSGDTSDANAEKPEQPREGLRETIEAVTMAFLLAFLFRTFEAEAFVIPTGSMAPTLYGRHKEITCDKCEFLFAIGASDELDRDTQAFVPARRVETSFCPNCGYEMDVREWPAFKGDRILVNKWPYELGEPDRFDVLVFKYPENPITNYIKRLIGLPGEYIRIKQGDIWVREDDTAPWRIAYKVKPQKQRVLQLPVYDDRYPAEELLNAGWPERWKGMTDSEADSAIAGWSDDGRESAWTGDAEARSYALASAEELTWLRYRHYAVPKSVWPRVESGEDVGEDAKPALVTDFCAYNNYTGGGQTVNNIEPDVFWVGDLTIDATVTVDAVDGIDATIVLELIEGYRIYRCRIDLATGTATLSYIDVTGIEDEERDIATAETTIRGAGTYRLAFANVDQRLRLWHDDRIVEFERTGEFADDDSRTAGEYPAPSLNRPTEADLLPVGIAGQGVQMTVSDLVVRRDIYYRADSHLDAGHYGQEDRIQEYHADKRELGRAITDPDRYWELYSEHSSIDGVIFDQLGEEEFFVLGDNSPRSQDSRLWSNTRRAERRHAVPRDSLVGKAFFIYWPHGVPFGNDGKGYAIWNYPTPPNDPPYPSFSVPFYPYLTRMHRIR